ncbi:MAG: hypothetical protein GY797_17700 [Deltaproteobacteria bacterium]|nr:hypothetical protein [Deltaproteobacteria bacterium]
MAKIVQEMETKVIRTDDMEIRIDSFDIYTGESYIGEVEVWLPYPNLLTKETEEATFKGWLKKIKDNRIIYMMRMIPNRSIRKEETKTITKSIQKLILQDLIC